MENKDLEWIADVVEKLQTPQTYNERQRLAKILERVAPALIKALNETAIMQYGRPNDEDKFIPTGHTCNGCGHDYEYFSGGPKHRFLGVKRDGTDGEQCSVESLFQLLKEEQQKEDK